MQFPRILFLVLALLSVSVASKQNSDWFLHSSISPDGKTVAFSYKGDIYLVPVTGGTARPLTLHHDWDGHPVWSRDGKQLAFASDRNGNLDIYTMPASGGRARRLTYHSADDIPQDFSRNGKRVLFVSARVDSLSAAVFPTKRLTEMYTVALTGGTPAMISSLPASELQFSPSGKQLLYRDEKSYENPLRKGDRSAFARDIWLLDLPSGQHKQLTRFAGADHNPVWLDNASFYYTSEQGGGALNIWRGQLDGSEHQQITTFKRHPVRSLSISDTGTLAFTHHGSLYIYKENSFQRLQVDIANDIQEDAILPTALAGKITEFAVSPDGKEVAFIARGEVFVASTEFDTTRAITNTPQAERSVSFHKDGRTLLYAAEREGRWGLYESRLVDDSEPYFFAATHVKEQPLHIAKNDSFQPLYSPDGKKIAFLSGRDEIQVLNRDNKKLSVALSKQHNYSYADGDIQFSWAPDSYWLTADFSPRQRLFITNIGVFPADGSAAPVDISHSGYWDGEPRWHRDGEAILWLSTRYGQRDHGSWGRELDVLASFLTREAYDKFRLTEQEYALQKEMEEEKAEDEPAQKTQAKAKKAKKNINSDDKKSAPKPPLAIEWDKLEQRTVRLTMHSSDLGDAILTEDTQALYYLARFEKAYDLWRHNVREQKTELVAKLNAENASMALSANGEKLFLLVDGSLRHGKLGDKLDLKPVSAAPVMQLRGQQEREYMFDHSWRVIKDKFYRDDFHGVDWDAMGKSYRAKLGSIGHNRDFANLFAEMTGELNASHIGSRYRPEGKPTHDATASLGLLFDTSKPRGPLKVLEVLSRGPFDKAGSQVQAGVSLLAVNGTKLDTKQNLYRQLNHQAGKRLRLTFKTRAGKRFDEVIKPISLREENTLLYRRWVDSRAALVEELSNGRLGYVHIRAMNDASFREVYSQLLGKYFDKDAVVVDTRFNGGGWLHNDLAKLFSGEAYYSIHVRGREYAGDPFDQWSKPSILVVNEGNYSDAHGFAYTYRQLGLGDIVGMPVPGTMTAVWWEQGISGDFTAGVPQVGTKNLQGEYLENNQIEPKHKVNNDPESLEQGKDKQIEAAVNLLLEQLDRGDEPRSD